MTGIKRAEWRQPAIQGLRKSRVPQIGAYRSGKLHRMRVARGLSGTVPVEKVAVHVDQLREWGFTDYVIAAAAGIDPKTVRLIRHRHTTDVTNPYAVRILSVTHVIVPEMAGLRVPNIGTGRRLRALSALGWPKTELCARLGVDRSTLFSYENRPKVFYETWEAVKALYDELAATPGPSTKGRAIAVNRGYAPPLAWEGRDIDHPEHEPDLGDDTETGEVDEVLLARILTGQHTRPVPKGAERRAVIDHAIEHGWNRTQLAKALNISIDAADQALVRRRRKHRKEQAA